MYSVKEEYVKMNDGTGLYTIVFIPSEIGRYPIVFIRNPYCGKSESLEQKYGECRSFIEGGYAVVYQHCRGTGRSGGDCIPYVNERSDGLDTLAWIREQNFYKQEIFAFGGSYLSSVHLLYLDTKPSDVKAAVLEIQDSNRYNVIYRNGFLKVGLHGGWYVGMYKKNSLTQKNYIFKDSFKTMPLSAFSETVFGEKVSDFDEVLKHPDKDDGFWKTKAGGYDSYNSVIDADIPVLLTTSLYDIYTEGIMDMWQEIKPENRNKCALLVTPYDHSKSENNSPLKFEKGMLSEVCPSYALNWFNHTRTGEPLVFIEKGKVKYYSIFENKWRTGDYIDNGKITHEFYLNNRSLSENGPECGEITYTYNPYAPASFKGGVCNNFGGMQIQDPPDSRYDIVSFLSEPFEREMHIQGKMRAVLYVRSDCLDTCFYMRLSIVKNDTAYSLRDDITSLCYQLGDYTPNNEASLVFSFAQHSFMIQKGDRIRVDVSSSDFPDFAVHTNLKGLQSEQKNAVVAHNTIIYGKSKLIVYEE